MLPDIPARSNVRKPNASANASITPFSFYHCCGQECPRSAGASPAPFLGLGLLNDLETGGVPAQDIHQDALFEIGFLERRFVLLARADRLLIH